MSKRLMSHRILISYRMVGHETTALATSYILYELARNQDVQSKLRREIQGMENRISSDSVNKLKYLDAIVKEG